MTEAGMITSNPYDGERIAGTVGYALPGVDARVADERASNCPRRGRGARDHRAERVRGYWQMPDKTAESSAATGGSSPATSR